MCLDDTRLVQFQSLYKTSLLPPAQMKNLECNQCPCTTKYEHNWRQFLTTRESFKRPKVQDASRQTAKVLTWSMHQLLCMLHKRWGSGCIWATHGVKIMPEGHIHLAIVQHHRRECSIRQAEPSPWVWVWPCCSWERALTGEVMPLPCSFLQSCGHQPSCQVLLTLRVPTRTGFIPAPPVLSSSTGDSVVSPGTKWIHVASRWI